MQKLKWERPVRATTLRTVAGAARLKESLAVSTGSLHHLRASFSKLSTDSAIALFSLQEVLSVNACNFKSESELLQVLEKFPELLSHIGSCITSLFFKTTTTEGLTWVDFFRGFNRCCVKAPVSQSLNRLFHLFSEICHEVGISTNLDFHLGEDGAGKVTGSFLPTQLVMFLRMCWVLMHGAWVSKQSKDEKGILVLPDLTHWLILLSLVVDLLATDAWGMGLKTINR